MKNTSTRTLNLSSGLLALSFLLFCSFAPLQVNDHCPDNGVFDLNVEKFALEMDDLEKHSENFFSEMGYNNDGGSTLDFSSPQVTPIKKTILRMIKNEMPAGRCVVPGLRFYYGLDAQNGRIIHYAVADFLYLQDIDLSGSNAVFTVGNGADNLISAIDKGLNIYTFDGDGNPSSIKGNEVALLAARTSWINYTSSIRIDRLILGERRFDYSKDITSVFYPLEELEAFCLSEPTLNYFFAENCVRRIKSKNKHVIHLSHRNVANKETNAKDGLDKVSPVSDSEIDAFKGKAADYAQLCPTKCGRIAATYLSDKTFTLSKD